MSLNNQVQIIGSDAGGTMTDMFVVDSEGKFVVGKAASTPRDESVGFWESLCDAFEQWDVDFSETSKDILPGVEAIVYSGTTMLNVLVTATGRKVGLIVQRGDENILIHERSRQTYAGYSYQDMLHHVTHAHTKPLVPRRLIKGVTGRINMFGQEVIQLYEHEARRAVEELLEDDVHAIGVNLYYSYLNPVHELKVAEIANYVMKERGVKVPVYLSHSLVPIMREQARLNSVILEAYAAEPSRNQLHKVEKRLHQGGYKKPLQIVLSHGGLSNIRYPRLHEACFSGPIGGLLGAGYMGQEISIPNWVCTDMGGTSFEVGLIMGSKPTMLREVTITRRMFNIPTLLMDTIGAGTGMFVTIDPLTKRVLLGPESAGSEPGPVSYGDGNETPTVMDCNLILGILNPDYFLGGKKKLKWDLAHNAIKKQCADPLGVDPYYFAEGVVNLINSRMKEHIQSVLHARGFSTADYCLLCYGGAGPMHLAGYSKGLPFKGIATAPWAAAFSSFGCAAVDFIHRYQKSSAVMIPHGAENDWKTMMGAVLNEGWDALEKEASRDLTAEGHSPEAAQLQPIAYVRYGGQMEDLEVISPVRRINVPQDMDKLIAAFEDVYDKVFAEVAKYPMAGYQILEIGLLVTIEKIKPKLVKRPLEGKNVPPEALKGERKVYSGGEWQNAKLYEMDMLRPGNELHGPSIVEAPSTTLYLPLGRTARMDEWSLIWLS